VGYGPLRFFFEKGVIQVAVKDDVFAIAEPVVKQLGYELVEVEYVKEGPRWFVRVYLFKPEGVGLDDCRAVNDALGPVLEAADPVKTPYNLEISSPGAERVLKTEREYKIFQDRLVKLALREPVAGDQALYGRLGPVTDHQVQLTTVGGETLAVARDNVKQIRLALESSVK
jgi:ribosome maturation factor RimP